MHVSSSGTNCREKREARGAAEIMNVVEGGKKKRKLVELTMRIIRRLLSTMHRCCFRWLSAAYIALTMRGQLDGNQCRGPRPAQSTKKYSQAIGACWAHAFKQLSSLSSDSKRKYYVLARPIYLLLDIPGYSANNFRSLGAQQNAPARATARSE